MRQHRDDALRQNRPCVVLLINEMNCGAAIPRSRGKDGAVHPLAVVALSPKCWQERRVNVEDGSPVCAYYLHGYQLRHPQQQLRVQRSHSQHCNTTVVAQQ